MKQVKTQKKKGLNFDKKRFFIPTYQHFLGENSLCLEVTSDIHGVGEGRMKLWCV